ncbi:MAG: hypothetical protein ACTSUE_10110 [Promethearchaeota archaeon]
MAGLTGKWVDLETQPRINARSPEQIRWLFSNIGSGWYPVDAMEKEDTICFAILHRWNEKFDF